MDILSIQMGWIGGKKKGEEPPVPPEPTGNPKGGGLIINIHEVKDPREHKRRKDEEILFL